MAEAGPCPHYYISFIFICILNCYVFVFLNHMYLCVRSGRSKLVAGAGPEAGESLSRPHCPPSWTPTTGTILFHFSFKHLFHSLLARKIDRIQKKLRCYHCLNQIPVFINSLTIYLTDNIMVFCWCLVQNLGVWQSILDVSVWWILVFGACCWILVMINLWNTSCAPASPLGTISHHIPCKCKYKQKYKITQISWGRIVHKMHSLPKLQV